MHMISSRSTRDKFSIFFATSISSMSKSKSSFLGVDVLASSPCLFFCVQHEEGVVFLVVWISLMSGFRSLEKLTSKILRYPVGLY